MSLRARLREPKAQSYLSAILFMVIGLAMITGQVALDQQVDAYRREQTCKPEQQSRSDCFHMEYGTLKSARVDVIHSGVKATVVLVLGKRTVTARIAPSVLDSHDLTDGQPAAVRFTGTHVDEVTVAGHTIPSDDNPVANQQDLRLVGVFMLVFATVIATLTPFQQRMKARLLRRPRRRAPRRAPRQAPILSEVVLQLPTLDLEVMEGGVFTVARPRFRRQALIWLVPPGFTAASLAFATYFGPRRLPPWVGFIIGGLVVVAALGWRMYQRNAAIFVDAESFGSVDLFKRRHPRRRDQLAQIARAVITDNQGGTQRWLVFQDHAGRALMVLGGSKWAPQILEDVAAALQVPIVGGWWDRMTIMQFSKRFPGADRWAREYAFAFGLIGSMIMAALATEWSLS